MACSITSVTSIVAAGICSAVLVLMKSAPAAMAMSLASAHFVVGAELARFECITFKRASPQASDRRDLVEDEGMVARVEVATAITMSISSAPSFTAKRCRRS
jgi:hypothetical protein